MDISSLKWDSPRDRQESAAVVAGFLDSYAADLEKVAIAPSFVEAAKKLSQGLKSPVLSNGEFRTLMIEFASELEKAANQAKQ